MHKAFTVTLAAVVVLGVAGTAHAQQEKTYGVLLKTLSDPFWAAMAQGIEDEAKAEGVGYDLKAVQTAQAAGPQLALCETMLAQKPALMLTAAVSPTNLLPCLKRATQEGIPVVDLDAGIDPAAAEKDGVKIALAIGSDNAAAGREGADYVASSLGPDAQGPVLVIEGPAGDPVGEQRTEAFKEELAKVRPKLRVVDSRPGDWDHDKAANITNDVLTVYSDLRAIFAANDVMALGAVETVFEAGQDNNLIVVGVGGSKDAVSSIEDDRLSASVAELPYLIGKEAVAKASDLLKGEKVPQHVAVPTLLLTQQVLLANSDPLLQYLK